MRCVVWALLARPVTGISLEKESGATFAFFCAVFIGENTFAGGALS